MGLEEFTDIAARLASTVVFSDQLANEFDGMFDRSYIEALVHESAQQLQDASVASFVPILTYRFARERLRAQAFAVGMLTKSAAQVVFVSITGGGRARMAASLLERRVGETVMIPVHPATTRPHHDLRPQRSVLQIQTTGPSPPDPAACGQLANGAIAQIWALPSARGAARPKLEPGPEYV